MKKLVQAFVSLIIATSTFGGVTNVAAKENTPAYKVEYQDADSMKSVFKKELHKKYVMIPNAAPKPVNTAIPAPIAANPIILISF